MPSCVCLQLTSCCRPPARLLQEEQQTGTAAGGSPATPGAYGAEEATTLQAASKEASLVAAQASADGSSSSEAAMPTAGSDKVVEQLTGGQIAGVVLGVAAAAGLTAVGVMAYRRHKRHASSTYGSGRYMRHGDIEML